MGLQMPMESIPEDEKIANQSQPKENQQPKDSQTASEFIDEQLALEASAREVLPYKFDKCTNILGPLRQEVYACLTCNPPPASAAQVYTPAGVCYACSISCHGEHNLVELFNRRNFVCDCGTTRMASTPCVLRSDPATGRKGVLGQEAAASNHYNHNFQNKFCACGEEYDAEKEKGTMFQCIGLGSVETGGCGEDWYHPECLVGLPRDWHTKVKSETNQMLETTAEGVEEKDHPVPPGFPGEDDFDAFACYKCVESNPWIKQYAGTPGFLQSLLRQDHSQISSTDIVVPASTSLPAPSNLKRKASDDNDFEPRSSSPVKRVKEDIESDPAVNTSTSPDDRQQSTQPSDPVSLPKHKHDALPPPSTAMMSVFMQPDFREHLCHCPSCYPNLIPHPQLVEEEDAYEPSISESNGSGIGPRSGTRSQGTGSLLDRGEAALSTMDRVKAIEGVMVYNHLKEKVKEFLKPYAESGKTVAAEDIKAYFEKLRGDEQGIKEAGERPLPGAGSSGGGDGDGEGSHRKEQSGY